MKKFTVINTNGNGGYDAFRVHLAGCRDVKKEVERSCGGCWTVEAESAEKAVEDEVKALEVDGMGYTAADFHICNCASARDRGERQAARADFSSN